MLDFLNSTFLLSILGFVLTVSFLVTIHEYGHFWVARKFGVKIDKFSIGFGKPIIKWYGKRDNTEYSISWIPLGGYVKMYGENSSELVDKNNSEQAKSFLDLSPAKRFLIAFAGPAINLIFAVLALWFIFILGVPALKPYVGSIQKESIFARASVKSGTKLIAINNSKIESLTDASMYFIDNIGNPNVNVTTIDNNGIKKTVNANLSSLPAGSEMNIEKALGFQWEIAEAADGIVAKIKQVLPNSPADNAGLKKDDIIVKADKKIIKNWQEIAKIIRSNPNKILELSINRKGKIQETKLLLGRNSNDVSVGYAGIVADIPEDLYVKYHMIKRFNWLEALPMAVRENYLQAKLILKTLVRMITGRASIKNMGGPITIADYSGKTLKMGYVAYLKFLAVISLTLAVMNLLPIPVLDGGHIALCVLEMIRGKPLKEQTGNLLLRIGMSVMLTFMLFVVTLDLWKYLLN